jgi:hypothetical protein
MNTVIRLQQHDAGILLTFLCRDEDGNPIDLTQYAVDFFLYNDATLLNEGRTLCTKPDSTVGVAEYTMTAEDTANPGLFQGKLRLSNGSSEVRNIGSTPVVILES